MTSTEGGDLTVAVSRMITSMYADGANIIDTIRAVRKEFDLPTRVAKNAVSLHPLWRSTAESHARAHDQLIKMLIVEGAAVTERRAEPFAPLHEALLRSIAQLDDISEDSSRVFKPKDPSTG